MMLCCRWPEVAADLPPRLVQAALSVSGVFELEPLRHAPFPAADLALTAASARRLSPVSMPRPAGPLLAVVGADESEEFIRQHRRIARAWGRRGVPVCEAVPGRHHMDVLHELAEPSPRVHQLALELLGLPLRTAPAVPGRDLHRAR
jgi:arylformamidase